MRTTISSWLPIATLTLVASTLPAAAQPPGVASDSSLTGCELIARIHAAAGRIAAAAGPGLRDSAAAPVTALTDLADRLERTFGATMDTPLFELRHDFPDAVEQGEAALVLAEDLARLLRNCVREDVGLLLTAFHSNFARTVGGPGSWSAGRARILRIAQAGSQLPGSIRAGAGGRVVLEGSNLESNGCGAAEATLRTRDGSVVRTEVSLGNDRLLSLDVPALEQPGLYEMTVRLRRRKLLFFCGSRTVATTVAVHAAAPIRVKWAVSTTISETREITWDAGELKRSNEMCADTIASAVFRLPDGWSYRSHEWTVFLNSGAEKVIEEVRGDGVLVAYRIPGRTGPFCRGAARLIHGKMTIHGVRSEPVPGPAIAARRPLALAFGGQIAVPIEIDAASDASISDWRIEVTFVYPDGSEHRIAPGTGSGRLEGNESGGGRFTWDPESRRLTISAPDRSCAIDPASPPPAPETRVEPATEPAGKP